VRFENGTVGVINREKASEQNPEISDLYIDIGASDKDEALKLVSPGDCASLYGELHHNFNRLIGKGLSNTAGCAVLLEALKQVPSSGFNLYIAFTVQGVLGARGAKVIGNQLSVQAGVSIDITPAADTPKPENLPVKLGKGAGIKVMDKTLLATPVIKRHLVGLAEKKGIPYQYEIHSHWGTDAGIINLSNGGVASGAISLPIRYPFSPMEMIDTRDLKACLDLTVALLEEDFPKA
jgi:putative aminopeptidase FrvX